MLAFSRLIVIGLIGLTVLFWLVRLYGRSIRREALENRWSALRAAGEDPGPHDDFIEAGMADYEKSFRRKLIWLVYILPITVTVIVVILMNYHW